MNIFKIITIAVPFSCKYQEIAVMPSFGLLFFVVSLF